MMEKPTKKSPILRLVFLCAITLFTAFLFACENNLDSIDTKEEKIQYEFTKADLEKEIENNLKRIQNAPQELIDNYISLQRNHPEYLYMPTIRRITKRQSSTFSLKKLKTLRSLGGLQLEIEYSKMLTNEETKKYFSPEDMNNLDIISSYAIIRKVDRLKHMGQMYKMNSEDNKIHDDYDKKATFKGGIEALKKHLKENLHYPELAKEQQIEDRLVMRFVVNKGGGLVYLNVDQEPLTSNEDVSLEFQIAAFKALHETEGLWEPAEKDGKYVLSRMTLPIEFKLDKIEN